ncbi:superoxide dismutase family protein [Actinomadura rubrisoli]|uniref:Superoxide dismutase [Cu-Zn] n=1 Tax=Actinomadura rubrisoli TaxID=2530368 RepID=A0A4R5AQH4_9ACTN|nr:superoxide dismutase family protein [Actinomadura rubrisoli]TDD73304.1 superoxide dismutase family protein [Actinomadura rubrisoli]
MKKIWSGVHLTAVATIGGLAATLAVSAGVQAATGGGQQDLTAQLRDVQGNVVGTLSVEEASMGHERVTVRVSKVPAGFHGLHVHTTGKCDPQAVDPSTGKVSPFFTAGGHLSLDAGKGHPGHSGDLPTLLVDEAGRGVGVSVTDRFQTQHLLDADGSAIVLHALPDNHANIPERYTSADGKKGPDAETLKAGDSGGRFACGVIQKAR